MRSLLAIRCNGFGRSATAVVLTTAACALALGTADSALASNGVVDWGWNGGGALGAGISGRGIMPEFVPVNGVAGVSSVSTDAFTSLAVMENGTVTEWGASSPEPTPVAGLSGVKAVAVGDGFNLALLDDGTVMAWGSNYDGQLGNGSTEPSATPSPVAGLSEVTAIAAGEEHALALLSDGTVEAWGTNNEGQLGDGSTSGPETCEGETACSTRPQPVSSLTSVTAIATGIEHSLALQSDGTVWSWGGDRDGQLGNHSENVSAVPIATDITNATAVSASQFDSLALLSNGTVDSWGNNEEGQLGDGTTSRDFAIHSVIDLSNVTAIAAGGFYGVALLGDGTVMAWGSNELGDLGTGSAEGPEVGEVCGAAYSCSRRAVAVSELSNVVGVAAGEGVSIAWGPVPLQVRDVSPRSGGDGTTVRILGPHVGEATAVKFGSTEATDVKVNSSTSITAVAPPGTGSVDVTVTTPEGTSPIDSLDTFTYSPSVSAITPSAGPASGGTSVAITGSNFTEVTEVKFGSTPAAKFVVNSPTSITAESPVGTGTVHVTVSTPGGESTGSSADEFTFEPAPTVTSLEPAEAAAGTRVTIYGTNIGVVQKVMFGSKEATGVVAREPGTSISATVPNGAGTVDVTVTTEGGTSEATPGDRFTYVPTGSPPTVTKVLPKTSSTAGGSLVVITGTNLSQAVAVQFGSAEASSFTVNSSTSITATAPAHALGTVDVTVTTTGGTSAVSKKDHVKYTPTVVNVSPRYGPTGGGTSVTITGTGFATATKATTIKFGKAKSPSVFCPSSTSCTATSPPGTAGTVDITVSVSKVASPKNPPADQFTYE